MVKTKSVYDPASEDDGVRVLVTRYWPRGVRKEQQDIWIKDLGPRAELIKAWKAGAIAWDQFKESYLAEFSSEAKKEKLRELKALVKAAKGDVTLLCACRQEEMCHRKLLKGLLARRS